MNQANSGDSDFSIITLGESGRVVRYIRRIIILLIIMHAAFLFHSVFYINNTSEIMIGNIVILSFFFYFTTEDTSSIVTAMVLWLLTMTTVNAAWINAGLFDSSLSLVPAILILAPLFSGR